MKKIFFETDLYPQFPTFPTVDTKFQGVELRLLESVHQHEKFPDREWIKKMAEFCKTNVKEIENWFERKNGMRFDFNENNIC